MIFCFFCHRTNTYTYQFYVGWVWALNIHIWRFMRTCALQNVCSTIVTEMKKKLCWHNGNLVFMTRFFRSAPFFFLPSLLLLLPFLIFISAVVMSPWQEQVCREHLSHRVFLTFILLFLLIERLQGFKWMPLFTSIMNEIKRWYTFKMSCKCFFIFCMRFLFHLFRSFHCNNSYNNNNK